MNERYYAAEMEIKQRHGKTLEYIVIEPDGYNAGKRYPLVMLLHGYGAGMADLAGLASVINSGDYIYVCPNGPMTVETGFGSIGYAWAPLRDQCTFQDLEDVQCQLMELLDEVMGEYDIEPGCVLLGGFSQGGMMTYFWGLTHPRLFVGLVVLSGLVPYPENLRPLITAHPAQSIFIAHGVNDAIVSIEEAQKAREFLESQGYRPSYKEYLMGHEITQELLDELKPWIQEALMSLGPTIE